MSGSPKGQAYRILMARRADDLLGDGEWHDLEETISALMDLVPPGVAERRAEAMRQHANRTKTPRVKPRTKEQIIRIGARSVVIEFLRTTSWEYDRPGVAGDKGPPRRIRQVRPHSSLRGDPYRLQRDQLTLRVDKLSKVITKMAKVMVDHGLAEDAERLTKGLKL